MRLGESAELLLGEDLTSVHLDFEYTARSANELDLEVTIFGILSNLVRQTGGTWLVVSRAAVGDLQFHR